MKWQAVGEWLKENGGQSVSLIGSLLTGNVPAAVAAGVGLVSAATGTNEPREALEKMQLEPETLLKLKTLYFDNEADIRRHIEALALAQMQDDQAEHEQTQETIRAGDNATDRIVRLTRPSHASVSLLAAIAYVFTRESPDHTILVFLLGLPFGYAGLRQIGKGIDSFTQKKIKT